MCGGRGGSGEPVRCAIDRGGNLGSGRRRLWVGDPNGKKKKRERREEQDEDEEEEGEEGEEEDEGKEEDGEWFITIKKGSHKRKLKCCPKDIR